MVLKSLQGEEENGAAAPICESESDGDDCGDNDGARLAVISRNKKRSFYTIIVPFGRVAYTLVSERSFSRTSMSLSH